MAGDSLTLIFPDTTLAEANQLAGSLQECLSDTDPEVKVDRRRLSADTQDFGASLAVMLGTAAATALAKGIAAWMARNSGVSIQVRRPDGSIVVLTHLNSRDVPSIVAALTQDRQPAGGHGHR